MKPRVFLLRLTIALGARNINKPCCKQGIRCAELYVWGQAAANVLPGSPIIVA